MWTPYLSFRPSTCDMVSPTKLLLDFHEILYLSSLQDVLGAKIRFEKFGQSYGTDELKWFPPHFPNFLADIFEIRRQETSTQINPFGLNAAFVKMGAVKPYFRCGLEGIYKRPVDICLPTWKKFGKRNINVILFSFCVSPKSADEGNTLTYGCKWKYI
jgi:hypothetical protein